MELNSTSDGAKRILLVSGELSEVSAKSWTYGQTTFKTPIMSLPGDRRVWIRWDAKDLVTMMTTEIVGLLAAEGNYRVRLREAHALELQERLLAEMGRIGLIARMPGTFPVRITAYSHGPAGSRELVLPITAREGGVCYVGRDKDGNERTKLVMTEGTIDELLAAVGSITPAEVHERARDALARLQKAKSFGATLQQGMPVPKSDQTNFATIRAAVPEDDGQVKEGVIGLIARNPSTLNQTAKNGALVLVISDLEVVQTSPVNSAPVSADEATPDSLA